MPQDCCAEIANMYCENGCDLIQTCDPCSSGDMISPKMYEQHVVPTLEGLTSQLKIVKHFAAYLREGRYEASSRQGSGD